MLSRIDKVFLFAWLDKLMVKFFQWYLHSQRQKFIDKGYRRFVTLHSEATEAQCIKIKEAFEHEATRVYPMMDKSILKASIKKARYTFLFLAIFATLAIGFINWWVLSGHLFTLFTPLIMAFLNWIISNLTMPISYNGRAKGAMEGVIATFKSKPDLTHQPNLYNGSPHTLVQAFKLNPQVIGRGVNDNESHNYGTFSHNGEVKIDVSGFPLVEFPPTNRPLPADGYCSLTPQMQ